VITWAETRGGRYFSHLVVRWTSPSGRHHKEVLSWRRHGRFWLWTGKYSGTTSAVA